MTGECRAGKSTVFFDNGEYPATFENLWKEFAREDSNKAETPLLRGLLCFLESVLKVVDGYARPMSPRGAMHFPWQAHRSHVILTKLEQ